VIWIVALSVSGGATVAALAFAGFWTMSGDRGRALAWLSIAAGFFVLLTAVLANRRMF